ncbi:MAG: AmmeMemoRadiSam system protein B [Methanosarcinales archaeon]|jgi:AmmeMemoRadiSam system protein B|nr:AmmeMemoRadiSam system protein B [Methanosarcinales archaeon]
MREPVVSGLFYSPDKEGLTKELDHLFAEAKGKSEYSDKTFGVVSPHAGYIFSGKTAAAAIDSIMEADTYIIIGSNHTGLGEALAFSQEIWKTPLGEVETDKQIARIFDGTWIVHDEAAHRREHSIEVNVPFLQLKMEGKPFKIFPIVMGDQNKAAAEAIANILIPVMKEGVKKEQSDEKLKIAIVASSDFSHYVPEDFAKEHDEAIINRILALDVNEFYDFIDKYDSTLCGYGPIGVLIMVAKALHSKTKLLEYRTSNEERESREAEVVGYAAMTFTKQ